MENGVNVSYFNFSDIKPFSYKVAKALDTHIYRNIEFDVWNDLRKNARFKQWSQGDTLQVKSY